MEIKTADGTHDVASSGVGTTGVTLGAIGTGLALLNNGGLGGILGGGMNNAQAQQIYATKTDLAYAQELAKKDSEIALLKSEQNTEVKIADVYERVMTRVNADQRLQADWNAQQMVNNATMSNAITTNANSISTLQALVGGITKVVVPKDAVCPEPMARYNSWTAPTNPQ